MFFGYTAVEYISTLLLFSTLFRSSLFQPLPIHEAHQIEIMGTLQINPRPRYIFSMCPISNGISAACLAFNWCLVMCREGLLIRRIVRFGRKRKNLNKLNCMQISPLICLEVKICVRARWKLHQLILCLLGPPITVV